jgi:ComF family protein
MFSEFIELLFPRPCVACGKSLNSSEKTVCIQCLSTLPRTDFHVLENNQLERLFWGRVEVERAASFCYYGKSSPLQLMIHELKYRGDRKMGMFLGRLFAQQITANWADVDYLIPIPLHRKKLRKRGFNQAELIARGMSDAMGIPLRTDLLERVKSNETQTNKSVEERAENVAGIFALKNSKQLEHKRVLLIDDVITTGATMGECVAVLNQVEGVKVRVGAIAFGSG